MTQKQAVRDATLIGLAFFILFVAYRIFWLHEAISQMLFVRLAIYVMGFTVPATAATWLIFRLRRETETQEKQDAGSPTQTRP